MPERLSFATVAACGVLAAVVFGGAYALAHGGPAKPVPAPAPPTTIRLANEPVGALHRVSPLPALKVPPPPPKQPAQQQQPVVTVPTPVVSAPAPTPAPAPRPAPAPKPKPHAPAKAPLTFDDSG
jgi:outer membrane biosynthesis protein TonB